MVAVVSWAKAEAENRLASTQLMSRVLEFFMVIVLWGREEECDSSRGATLSPDS